MRATRVWALAALCLSLLSPASAVRPEGQESRRDARRFGPERLNPSRRKAPHAASSAALAGFNRREGGRWSLRFDPRTGRPSALVGGRTRARPGPPEAAARLFLSESRDLLGLEPEQLSVERQTSGPGHAHLLYRQAYLGVPVEFARVKVHLDGEGAVTGVHSGFEPLEGFSVVPRLGAAQAAAAVRADLGEPPRTAGELVIYPSPRTGRAHLAWKFSAGSRSGRWTYYVDAQTGEVLFRVNPLRFAVPVCLTSGVVSGLVYDLDPTQSVTTSVRPFDNQRVYVVDGSTFSTTGGVDPVTNPEAAASGGRGFFCNGFSGKVFTQLQGPFLSVANFSAPSAHYDNANGVWSTVATPVSSPHPYANATVATSTINLVAVAPQAVKFMPVFTSFDVGRTAIGTFGELLDFIDNDAVEIVDSFGNPVAAYVGDRGSFHGAAVPGRLLRLRLRSNEAGTGTGFDVAVSSYLTLPSAGTNAYASFTWDPARHTAQGLRSEISLFYHLNKMHDYFVGGPIKSSAAFLGAPVAAMAFTGPSLVNAFYDPDLDRLFFGDINSAAPSDIITDDATVPRHEYAHYMLEKIWPIQNFGQAGAISEAMADYFAASSFGNPGAPRIGLYFNQTFGFSGALRELDCAANPPCRVLSDGSWLAEIHEDAVYVGQALWDLRKDRMAQQGPINGQACADGLFFQSLLFFPENFQELLDAMLRVDAAGTVPECGQSDSGPDICGGVASGCAGSVISAKFAAHGLPLGAGGTDPYDLAGGRHNDGFGTAVDITTMGAVSATIFPQADVDYFAFSAAAGPVSVSLSLPADPDRPGLFKGYMVTAYDKDHNIVAEIFPPFDGFNTFDGACAADDCTTTASSVTAEFENPSPGKVYLQVSGGFSVDFSNSGVHSEAPYSLSASWRAPGALASSVVTASFDNDTIGFSVSVATFPQRQEFSFAYAQLRDHSQQVLPQTLTLPCTALPCSGGGFLTAVSSSNALGKITGRVRLNAGFADRFPTVGTVHLEVFGYNVLGSTSSLGLSQPFNLTADRSEVRAWNNVFNPARGEKTTVKYDVLSPGRLTMKLFTLSGNLVATLFDADVPRGKGAVDWHGTNTAGNRVASGLYMLHVRGPGLEKTQKIAVVK